MRSVGSVASAPTIDEDGTRCRREPLEPELSWDARSELITPVVIVPENRGPLYFKMTLQVNPHRFFSVAIFQSRSFSVLVGFEYAAGKIA